MNRVRIVPKNYLLGFTSAIRATALRYDDRLQVSLFLSTIHPATLAEFSRCTAGGHNGHYVIPLATMHNNKP